MERDVRQNLECGSPQGLVRHGSPRGLVRHGSPRGLVRHRAPRGDPHLGPDRVDGAIALVLALAALFLYIRTLAPGVLYSDSAEFQTLAYTLGTTHCTGYPVYLLLARVVGFIPLQSPAWRINLVSALAAAVTVAGVYTLTRTMTRSRLGAAVGSAALALSTTFWSQAIIAEVYTPATAFIIVILNLLAVWAPAPLRCRWLLGLATALTCLGLGVHASVPLLAPTAVIFVLWVLVAQRKKAVREGLVVAGLGFAVGFTLYALAFALLELNNPPASFIRVMLYPSRSIWGLQASEIDGLFERGWLTITGLQWQTAMFPEDVGFWDSLNQYVGRVVDADFSWWALVLALVGQWEMRRHRPKFHAFLLGTYLVMMGFILNYHPGDKHLFYLPTYVIFATAMGSGLGALLTLLWRWGRVGERWLVAIILIGIVVLPRAELRWEALRAGKATFVTDTYPYPVEDLDAPRQIAMMRLQLLPENALLVMNWRALYTMAYMAHVEGLRPNLLLMEATPYGSEGRMAQSLLTEIDAALDTGRPVLVDQVYDGLRDRYRVMPAPGGEVYRLSRR